ncbi:MAG: hypothetical protein HKN32_04465 [Flavobacteriales bacterium]|nr:hypothetical protein [Flavobacteriales bacterium]
MGGDKSRISPIMTNSESIYQFGNNAYGKPATALNILRETIMGRELFDHAFKEYSRRWAFKHPSPADFFRSMEDASAVDLDWFWRGWFYGTDHCDINMKEVKWFQIDTKNPEIEKPFAQQMDEEEPLDISIERDRTDIEQTFIERDPSLNDFYTTRDIYKPTQLDKQEYQDFVAGLEEEELRTLNSKKNFYEITFQRDGGLIMPLIVEFEFEDGSTDVRHIPAEIWKRDEPSVTKVFITNQPAIQITLDPFLETADVDLSDNYWPPKPTPSRFELYKNRNNRGGRENPMQRDQRNQELQSEGGSK